MATSTAIINAARDSNIRERAIAIAAEQGIENPQEFVNSRMYDLATTKVDTGSEQNLADVLDYSREQKNQKRKDLEAELRVLQEPGEDLTAVTDEHLRYALARLNTQKLPLQDGEGSTGSVV